MAAVLPQHCVGCRAIGSAVCPACRAALVPAADVGVPGLDAAVALFSYEGVGRSLIGRLKFENHRDAVPALSRALARGTSDAVVQRGLAPIASVTWVPTTADRVRARGFDQAELIARRVAAELRVPCMATVRRIGHGHQTGLDRRERWAAAFTLRRATPRRAGDAGTIVVVDDVRTTGASLSAVATELRRRGATTVVGATLAATPGQVPRFALHPLQSG